MYSGPWSIALQCDRGGEWLAARRGCGWTGRLPTDAWREAYKPSLDRVRKGELPWTKLDQLHRMTLDELLFPVRLGGSSVLEGQ